MSQTINVGDKLPEVVIGPFDAGALSRYAQISGDDNPLHLDDAIAAKIGLAAPPVHGMKLLAAFEPMLANWRDDLMLVGLSAKFIQPVLRGEVVKLSGRVLRASESEIFVRLFAHGAARAPGIIGEATLRPVDRTSPR
ncbi:MaoC/PaaZ C-terminal domain-containing protein [Methylocystis sp. JR02]|uniref:MaoC family dehydratase n=1 Tax=Methylocystis sp. JR02 TaxID=3046284 RepID=UPI0024B95862|nr:MaoC/PaaZ C-terminal domain-containing protein [Methylocystis sp. JR02]MDJ0450152.1 MaoC/PaaZ C-terminal domain-containing protein [Methylocystis sp. JR02]